jgi:hypothetical protein
LLSICGVGCAGDRQPIWLNSKGRTTRPGRQANEKPVKSSHHTS